MKPTPGAVDAAVEGRSITKAFSTPAAALSLGLERTRLETRLEQAGRSAARGRRCESATPCRLATTHWGGRGSPPLLALAGPGPRSCGRRRRAC